jgi:hypothetical protein
MARYLYSFRWGCSMTDKERYERELKRNPFMRSLQKPLKQVLDRLDIYLKTNEQLKLVEKLNVRHKHSQDWF